MRVCVVGLGPIGNLHADVYRNDPLARLDGVCDHDRERADAVAASESWEIESAVRLA